MDLEFFEKLAYYVVKGQPTSELPILALQGLEDGYESNTLILLSGMPSNESPFVIDEYFQKMLIELGLNFFDKQKAAFFLIQSAVKKIVAKQVDPFEGCKWIFDNLLSRVELSDQDQQFVYDSIGLGEIYGLYIAVEDILSSTMNWDKSKTNEQLIDELKLDMLEKLSNWKFSFRL